MNEKVRRIARQILDDYKQSPNVPNTLEGLLLFINGWMSNEIIHHYDVNKLTPEECMAITEYAALEYGMGRWRNKVDATDLKSVD
jgi:hypothetical protein